jgi:hypothetical protein
LPKIDLIKKIVKIKNIGYARLSLKIEFPIFMDKLKYG